MNATYELIETYPGSPPLGTRIDNIQGGLIEKIFLDGKKVTLKEVLKYPQFWKEITHSLFTTFDNVKIFEGDELFLVSDNFQLLHTSFATKNRDEKIRCFSTKENAENWILENKPCLSCNDLLNNMDEALFKKNLFYIDKNKLKELIKSKL